MLSRPICEGLVRLVCEAHLSSSKQLSQGNKPHNTPARLTDRAAARNVQGERPGRQEGSLFR